MTDEVFNAQDLEDLGRQLDEATEGFDERTRTLLLAIVALASEGLAARQGEVVGFSSPSVNEIVVTKAQGGTSSDLFRASLGGLGGGGDLPTESFSLNFTKISFT